MKNGFTLVELSIVLVIIGLLIGGILVAQSLIDSAKVQRLTNDLGQYEAAIKLFKANYRYYPGDSPNFIPPGDADNVMGPMAGCASAPNASLSVRERIQAWAHLSQAGMLDYDYVPWSPQSCTGGTHTSTYGSSQLAGIVWPYTELNSIAAGLFGVDGSRAGIFLIKNTAGSNPYLEFGATPLDTLALESKLGSEAYNSTDRQVGLVNAAGSTTGVCYDTLFNGDYGYAGDDAGFGHLFYYIK